MTTFYIETYGCSANVADSEQMAGLLQEANFQKVDQVEDADIVVLNSCTVKQPGVDSFINRVKDLKKIHPYKTLIITGCIPQAEPKKFKEFSIVGTKQIHNIVQVVEEALNDNVVKALQTGEMPPLNLPKVRKNKFVEIIPINRGCLSACTFCKTKQARGNLQSYPIEDILQLATNAIREGVTQIWLTSQDTFCYGFDLKTNLAELLQKLVQIPGKFKIRVGMGNPIHLKKIKEQLLPLFNHEKVFKFIHIPMQAGSDTVLETMRRGNTDQEFRNLVQYCKETVPNITLATDIIVGFPTETAEDFSKTVETVKSVTPDIIHISRFWPRPGTPAAEMEPLPIEEIKRRSALLTDIFHNISRLQNERWMGWEGTIIIDEEGKKEGQWIGRNDMYKVVTVDGSFKLGDHVPIRVTGTDTFHLKGTML